MREEILDDDVDIIRQIGLAMAQNLLSQCL